ncbi:hypothetical protein K2X30_15655 [bacterium]|nr:hypothetical protein [bacterium]
MNGGSVFGVKKTNESTFSSFVRFAKSNAQRTKLLFSVDIGPSSQNGFNLSGS